MPNASRFRRTFCKRVFVGRQRELAALKRFPVAFLTIATYNWHDMGGLFQEQLTYLLTQAWRDRRQMGDRWGVAVVVGLAALILYAAIAAMFWARWDRGLWLFCGGCLLAGVFVLAAWWVASDPKRPGRGPAEEHTLSLFSVGPVKWARGLRWLLPPVLILCGLLAWMQWIALPKCPPHPGKICIRVARFWDPKTESCDSEAARQAQHALVRTILDEARKHEALAERVIVKPVAADVTAEDPVAGHRQARELAIRLRTDLVVWGSLSEGDDGDVYWVSVARAGPAPALTVEQMADKVSILTDPCPPELSQRPLLVATFVLAYGAYSMGEWGPAISLFEEVLSRLGEPAGAGNDTARVSFYLGTSHLQLGVKNEPRHFEPAMDSLARAVDLTDDEEMFAVKAAALVNWGTALSSAAQRQRGAEAVSLFEEACEKYVWALSIYRELAQAEPAAFQPKAARTLSNLGTALGDRGERSEARQALEEALSIYRGLAKAESAAFQPDVARTLNNLGNVLRDSGERTEARQALEEALSIHRELAKAEPAAFQPDVARTLNNLGTVLGDRGEGAEARQAFEEALSIYRELAQAEPAAFQPDVAMTLNNLGVVLRALGERAQGRQAFEEALSIYRELAQAEPAAFLPYLAGTLNNLGTVLRDLGERAPAREAYEEALPIYRKLAEAEPAAFLPDVAMTLYNLGSVLRAVGERPQAREAWDEALTIYTRYARGEPRAFGGYLMIVMRSALELVEQTDENPEDWPALVEAREVLAEIEAAPQDDGHDES